MNGRPAGPNQILMDKGSINFAAGGIRLSIKKKKMQFLGFIYLARRKDNTKKIKVE